ncbi:MAG: hypothetical protein M1348_02320 [Candidatus Parvarchaeota archaeon]|jgi:sulfur carrier protein ThiS|nr:hypothetical protein [Candidatus Parvarchaeota archaeon]MCL5101421.1 hypothetical protein [Candidatus Parvarchaeota archaeon]
MISVKVNGLNQKTRKVSLKTGSVNELIGKLNANDDSILIVGEDGKIFTKDRKLRDGSSVSIIEVFSGG